MGAMKTSDPVGQRGSRTVGTRCGQHLFDDVHHMGPTLLGRNALNTVGSNEFSPETVAHTQCEEPNRCGGCCCQVALLAVGGAEVQAWCQIDSHRGLEFAVSNRLANVGLSHPC